jgi:hypothetical protein
LFLAYSQDMKETSMLRQFVYPPDFVEAVKAAFPNWEEMHRRLERNSEIVGLYLCDSIKEIPAEEIVSAIEQGKIKELAEKARTIATKRELYSRWQTIVQAHR